MDPQTGFLPRLFSSFAEHEDAVRRMREIASSGKTDDLLNLQVVLNSVGYEEEAWQISERLLQQAPDDPRVLFNRGWHLLKRRELRRGLALLEAGRVLNSYGNQPIASRQPLWQIEGGRGQRVHLVLEGGYGDEIIQFRFAKNLAEEYGCKVNVVGRPALSPLFARCDFVSSVLQREACLGVFHDAWLPGMSAALALNLEYSRLSGQPYLKADRRKSEIWKSRIATDKLKVAIRWAGNPQFEHQQFRSFPPSFLFDLAKRSEVRLFSVQRDDNLQNLSNEIVDLGPSLTDWDETAAALSQMDLVITSCTSVAHLAGALGVETWVIVPVLAYFIWAYPGDKSPWYESVSLIRQKKFGDWSNVQTELNARFDFWIQEKKGLSQS